MGQHEQPAGGGGEGGRGHKVDLQDDMKRNMKELAFDAYECHRGRVDSRL
jgi:hypothetical protein